MRILIVDDNKDSLYLLEARVVIENRRREYNRFRPHNSLGYRPPAPDAFESRILTLEVVQ